MQLNVKNETSTLKAVVLGQPGSIGKVPTLEETYDAKSYESVLHHIYPHEEDIFKEMRCFESVLLKYGVQVYRPWTLENCINPEKPDVPLNKNDAFQKVQKRRVQEKR